MVPSNVLVTRLRPAWYLSGWMMAWAVVSTLTCLVKDYHGMLASRSVPRGSDEILVCPDLALKNRPWFHRGTVLLWRLLPREPVLHTKRGCNTPCHFLHREFAGKLILRLDSSRRVCRARWETWSVWMEMAFSDTRSHYL